MSSLSKCFVYAVGLMTNFLARNIHPNVEGHAKIADKFSAWLEDWGLHSP
jgi:hypothetical protein